MIKLKPHTGEHVSSFYSWLNDKEVVKYALSLFQRLQTRKLINNWYNKLLNSDDCNYGIFLDANDKFIGYAGKSKISIIINSGEYFIFIGEKEYWVKGTGTEVTINMLDLAFKQLILNRVMQTVSELNIAGKKAYQRAGFVKEGIIREAFYRNNKYHDKVVISVLYTEWLDKRVQLK